MKVVSLVVDPDDLYETYSAGDTLTITFDRETNMAGEGVLTAAGALVRVWRPDDGTPVRTLQGHTGYVRAATCFDRGGGWVIVTASYDRPARGWERESGAASLDGRASPPHDRASSGLGSRASSAGSRAASAASKRACTRTGHGIGWGVVIGALVAGPAGAALGAGNGAASDMTNWMSPPSLISAAAQPRLRFFHWVTSSTRVRCVSAATRWMRPSLATSAGTRTC